MKSIIANILVITMALAPMAAVGCPEMACATNGPAPGADAPTGCCGQTDSPLFQETNLVSSCCCAGLDSNFLTSGEKAVLWAASIYFYAGQIQTAEAVIEPILENTVISAALIVHGGTGQKQPLFLLKASFLI